MGSNLSTVDRALRAINRLRPPAPAVDHLLAELSLADVSFSRLARLIQTDSMLTAALLQRANSAIFQRGSSVHSVLQALTLLGIEEVRRFALTLSSACLCPKIDLPPHFSRTRYARHTSATAVMTGLLERELGYGHNGHTSIAALLHDISKLLVAVALPGEFERIVENGNWDEDREHEILGVDHGELSSAVLAAWKLPQEVSLAVAEHHKKVPAGLRPSLAELLRAADNYTTVLAERPEPDLGDFDEYHLCGLGVDAAIPTIVADFQTQIHIA